jgi:hypothetical protein
MRGEARGELVKPLPRLVDVESTRSVGSVGLRSRPDRERQVARQAMTMALDDRIESRPLARSLGPRRMHPAHHGWRSACLVAVRGLLASPDDAGRHICPSALAPARREALS